MKDRMIQNGIEYERRGEQYYPLLDLGEQTRYEIGKYGKLYLALSSSIAEVHTPP